MVTGTDLRTGDFAGFPEFRLFQIDTPLSEGVLPKGADFTDGILRFGGQASGIRIFVVQPLCHQFRRLLRLGIAPEPVSLLLKFFEEVSLPGQQLFRERCEPIFH